MGKFTDKFLGAFSLKDDDYDDYDDYDEYDDDGYYEDEDYYEDEEPERGRGRGGFMAKKEEKHFSAPKPQQAPARQSGGRGRNEVCIIKPSSIEDSREITETLLQGKAVVVNFEGLRVDISQRIIDFISGSCYALDGNLQKISNNIFIATPNSVDLSGDFQEIFGASEESGFDISGLKSPML